MKHSITILLLLTLSAMSIKATNDIIRTTDNHDFEVTLIAITGDSVFYTMNNSPFTFSLPLSRVSSIANSKGQVVSYDHSQDDLAAQVAQEELPYAADIASVSQFHGIYVFTECTPIAPYEVIGTVAYSGSTGAVGYDLGYGSYVATDIKAQYTSIRSGLVRQALTASNEVQGIIIEADQEGAGVARMIKFKSADNQSLARVNTKGGYYIYIDNQPTINYSSYGSVDVLLAKSSMYIDVLNKLIRKANSQHTNANALLVTFVEGGMDKARMVYIGE